MTLDDIPGGGSRVLVDANIIIYMLGRKSPRCRGLLARRLGIQEIATTDSNFDHIPGLIVYKPGDLAA